MHFKTLVVSLTLLSGISAAVHEHHHHYNHRSRRDGVAVPRDIVTVTETATATAGQPSQAASSTPTAASSTPPAAVNTPAASPSPQSKPQGKDTKQLNQGSGDTSSNTPSSGQTVGVQGGPNDPLITIVNKSNQPQSYVVVRGDNAGAGCYSGGTINVAAGSSVDFHPGNQFIGAITADGGKGTRFEPNFAQGTTWYDADMEMGMSDATLSPNGGSGSAVAGEKDTLAKANNAWNTLDAGTKSQLLATPYFQGNAQGLTSISMDKSAPYNVIKFFQLDASFNAYITHGSYQGKDNTASDSKANGMSLSASTNKFVLTSY